MNTRISVALACIVLALTNASSAQAVDCGGPYDVVHTDLRCTMRRGTCVVRESYGGDVDGFVRDARRQRRIVVDGACYSSCAYVSVRYRHKVSITPRAVFGFHQMQVWSSKRVGKIWCFYDTKQRIPLRFDHAGLRRWIAEHGGQPRDRLLRLSAREALRLRVWKIWKTNGT